MKKGKVLKLIAFLFVSVMLFSGCSADKELPEKREEDKLKITATLFPQYDFARMIAGDKAEVYMTLPAGTESHNYEPSPADIIDMGQSDLFLYTGKYMETWAETIIESLPGDIYVLDLSEGIVLEEYEDHDHSYEEIHEGHEHNVDPHIWTNPVFAKEMAIKICDALCGIDPENEEYYRGNLDEVILKLENLDSEFRNIVSESKDKFIVFGGRFAFYYFVEEYGISYVSAYESCSSEAEPSAAKISEIIKTVKDRGIKTIYYEELTTGKVADIICEETGAEKVILHSCHNISSEDFNSGLSYFDIMEQNAVNLRKGLN